MPIFVIEFNLKFKNMVILIEGARNVGKTFMLKNSKFESYKFPFIPYYKSMMAEKPEDTGHESKEAFHFTTAFDVTLFSMMDAGVISPLVPLLIDRSFLSNVVLGELQSRITHAEGLKYIDYLADQGYLDKLHMLYIDKFSAASGRSTNKDDWEFLGYEEQKAKYEQYFKYLEETYEWKPTRFINQMTKGDIIEFDNAIVGIHAVKAKQTMKKGVEKMKIFHPDFLSNIFDNK